MADTARLVEAAEVAGERPYRDAERREASLRSQVNLGGSGAPAPAPSRGRVAAAPITPGYMRFSADGPTSAPEPAQEPDPERPFWEPRQGEMFGVTGALNALDYITQAGRTTIGQILPGRELLRRVPKVGALADQVMSDSPTDATSSDQYIPAAARLVLSSALYSNAVVQGLRAGLTVSGEPGRDAVVALDPVQQHVRTRVEELRSRGTDENDAYRVASLENTYNTLGAVGAVTAGFILGVPATIAAGVGTAVRIGDPDTYRRWEERAARTLPEESFGGAAVEFGIPEFGVVTGAAKALQVARLRYAAGLKAATVGEDTVRLRLDALATFREDVAAVERATAPELAANANPEAAITRAGITAERIRASAAAARKNADAVAPLSEADEATLIAGIRAAVETLPSHERATTSLGQKIVEAERAAKTRMTRAVQLMLSKGERFRVQSVTVGADADDMAIRTRQMVGQYDQAIMDFEDALRAGGRSQEETALALMPFRRARLAAAQTLEAIDAHNAALRQDVQVASQERRAALSAVRGARREQAKAETNVDQATRAEEKAGERVEKQEARDAERQQVRVDTLQQRIGAQREHLAREKVVQYRVGGDADPTVTSKRELHGYPSSSDVAFLAEQGVTNIASWSPRTVSAMAEWLRADPSRLALGAEHINWADITAKVSDLTGESVQTIRKQMASLVRDNAMTKAFYTLNQVFSARLRAWSALGRAVKAGQASPELLEESTRDLLLLQADLRGGIGEVARTLAQQRLLKRPDAVEIVNLQRIVKARYADVERIAKRIDALEGKISEAQMAGPSGVSLPRGRSLRARSLRASALWPHWRMPRPP